MTITVDENGVAIETLDEILAAVAADLEAAGFRSDLESSFGQLKRIWSELEAASQESILAMYNTLAWGADGVHLDRVLQLLGVERTAALASRVTGRAVGTAGTVIPDLARIQYDDGEHDFLVEGPRTIPASGQIDDLVVVAQDVGEAIEVALDPDAGFDGWTILDSITGWDTFASTAQPVVGAPQEEDTPARSRGAVEAYRRGQGPLKAIAASVQSVDGVTAVQVYENQGLTTNADGIPGKAFNVVVEGGDTSEIVDAILLARPAGAEIFGTDESEERFPVEGYPVTVSFDRIADVDMWIQITLTTSTSEEQAPDDLTTTVEAAVLEAATAEFGIGDDVLPYRIVTAIGELDLPGIDAIDVQLSTDDGAADPYSTAKRAIGIRERAAFAAARISATEA